VGKLILVLGGVRSGKSSFAQRLAYEIGEDDVLFVATSKAGDEEMQRRIDQHRRERPASWHTLEVQQNVGQAIRARQDCLGHNRPKAILIDCLTVLVSNRLLAFDEAFAPGTEAAVISEVEGLAACAQATLATMIVVSNEVGMGIVPPYPLGRAYRDLLGQANQILARHADEVHLLVAGIPWALKGHPRQQQ
jgi:adenosylcobinamide kinase/adenosylcobinamide-phosphate guanylyltransferase